LLAEDAVFHSPVVHTPQRGRKLASWSLSAAFHVFFNLSFRYVREIVGPLDAIEFETEIDGSLHSIEAARVVGSLALRSVDGRRSPINKTAPAPY
jgi:hypothetical protein